MVFNYTPNKVSFSQLMAYIRCPEHYLFRYVLGLKSPPRKAQVRGRAFHEALAFYFQEKRSAKTPSLNQVQELYATALDLANDEYAQELEQAKPLLHKDYLQKEKTTNLLELLASGLQGLSAYYKNIGPKIKPRLVEEEFELKLNPRLKLSGRIDLIGKDGIIYETKTARVAPAKLQVELDPQLAFYRLGYKNILGQYPKGYSKDYIVFGRKEAKLARFQTKRLLLDEKFVQNLATNVTRAVQQNIWYCLHPTNEWICNREWCGYWKLHQELRQRGLEYMVRKYRGQ